MRKIISPGKIKILLFFSFLISIQTYAQSGSNEPDIAAIRQKYQTINSLKLPGKRYTYESSGCVEEGVVNYYLNNKEIVKITEAGAIGDGSWENEYYYAAGKVIFCLETIIGGPAIGKVTKTQYRYYIKDGHPLRVMEGNKIIPADSKVKEILQTANKIHKAYITKDFVSAVCDQ